MDNSLKEGIAMLLAFNMQKAATALKVEYEMFIDTCINTLGFTKDEAVAFANERLNDVNAIGDEYFRMKKEGKTADEIKKELSEKHMNKTEEEKR